VVITIIQPHSLSAAVQSNMLLAVSTDDACNRQLRCFCSRLRLKCDGTRAETRFRLSAKRTSPFKSAGTSVQSTTGRRAVHFSLQGLYCSCKPVFCSHVTLTGSPLHSLISPFTSPVRHRVPSHFNWTELIGFIARIPSLSRHTVQVCAA
jgi:hypothetical protein